MALLSVISDNEALVPEGPSVVTIEELYGETRQRFQWTSAKRPHPGNSGGAFAAPRGEAIPFGRTVRHKRTDYPGAVQPSVQVFGTMEKDFQISGVFDDRYNYPGFAVAEQRRLEEVIAKQRNVRFTIGDQSFICLIIDYDWPYKQASEIGYTLTLLNVGRDGTVLAHRIPESTKSIAVVADDIGTATSLIEEKNKEAPTASVDGDSKTTIDAGIADTRTAANAMTGAVDTSGAIGSPIEIMGRISGAALDVKDAAFSSARTMADWRSDTQMAGANAIAVLEFESWSRELRELFAVLTMSSVDAAKQANERRDAQGKAVYRPREGESLYSISNRFFGTPHMATIIAERNGLDYFLMTGDELLIIPEKGSV